MIFIDLMGPLPVLVVFQLFKVLQNGISEIMVKIVGEQLLLIHGVPQTIFLDNRIHFISWHTNALFKYKNRNSFYIPKHTSQIHVVDCTIK